MNIKTSKTNVGRRVWGVPRLLHHGQGAAPAAAPLARARERVVGDDVGLQPLVKAQ